MRTMTIAPASNGSAPQGDGSRVPLQSTFVAVPAALGAAAVPVSMREERLAAQIAQFARAGYHVERQSQFQAVMVREHKRPLSSRIAEAARSLGIVPLLVGAPRAFHRVLVRIDEDGATQIL